MERLEKKFATKDELKSGLINLTNYMLDRFDHQDRKIDQLRSDIYSLFDGLVNKIDAYSQEQTILINQLNVHDGWIHQLGNKVDLKLER